MPDKDPYDSPITDTTAPNRARSVSKSSLTYLRIVLSLLFGIVALLPIGFWGLLKSYYGWIPDEATLFGLNMRAVLVVISGTGLAGLILSNALISLSRRRSASLNKPG